MLVNMTGVVYTDFELILERTSLCVYPFYESQNFCQCLTSNSIYYHSLTNQRDLQ